MRIALDAMGGDRAPAAPVQGALLALKAFADVEIALVGDPAQLEAVLSAEGATSELRKRLTIEGASVAVDQAADPVRAVRHSQGSSARVAAELLASRAVDGVLTMGSTGAAVAAATLYCPRVPGVRRLGIAVPFPRPGGFTIVIDGGANPDARPEDLHCYALMARHYAQAALGLPDPRVGILSIGEEEHKGNRLVHETWDLFRRHPVPGFLGNVEPRELFSDRADVVVCDGFAGNIALKATEGMGEYLLALLGETAEREGVADPQALLASLTARADYTAYGGAPVLGLEGAYVIGHGRSPAEAYESGVRVIRAYLHGRVGERIAQTLAQAAQ